MLSYLLYPFKYLLYLFKLALWKAHHNPRTPRGWRRLPRGGRHKPRFLFLFTSILLVSLIPLALYITRNPAPTEANWFNDSWMYRKAITIDADQVSGSTDLSDFPVLVSLSTDTELAAIAQDNGNDLVFTDQNGKRLNHEIEFFDGDTGQLVAWVLLPTLFATSDTGLFLYYGNATVENQQQPEEVWNNHFIMVHHLQETSGQHLDSTRYNSDSKTVNVTAQGNTANGKIGPGDNFNGTSNYIDIYSTNFESALNKSRGTLSAWAKVTDSDVWTDGANRYVVGIVSDNTEGLVLAKISTNNTFWLQHYGDNGTNVDYTSATGQTSTDYQLYTITWDKTADEVKTYINGTQVGSTHTDLGIWDDPLLTNRVSIGASRITPTSIWSGDIDEVRVSTVPRSPDWIATEYANQNSPAAFLSLASEEVGPGPIAYWKFDEGQGIVAHNSADPEQGEGQITGATWQTEDQCISGKCLYFDGTDDVVTISNSINSIQTVSFWAKVMSTSTTEQLFDLNGTDYLTSVSGTVTANSFGTETIYVDGLPNTTLSANTWHHVTVTTSAGLSGSAIKLGQISSDYGQLFLDEVKIYPYARTADEIKQDYLLGAAKAGSSVSFGYQDTGFLNDGLVGYWKMDETSGTTVADASGNGNTGTLTNAQESGASDASGNTTTALIDTDSASLSTTDDAYNGMILRFTAVCGSITSGTERLISDYTGSTKTITVSTAFAAAPDSCAYEIRHQVGGKFGSGLRLDGVNDYSNHSLADASQLDAFTVSSWIKIDTTDTSNFSPVLGFAGPHVSVEWTDGKSIIYLDGANYKYFLHDVDLDDGNWHHVVFIVHGNDQHDIANAQMYADGQEMSAGSIAQSGTPETKTDIHLGRSGTTRLDGNLDEVRIYNRALSAAEVAALYAWAPGPVGHWKFDEGSGTTAFDSSGNNLTGTLLNSTDWGTGKYGSAQHITDIDGYTRIGDNDITDIMAGNFTWKGWFKTSQTDRGLIYRKSDAGNANGVLIDIGNGTPGIVRCNVHYNPAISVNTSNTYNDGQWHHYACVFDRNSSLKLYIDGQLDGNTTSTTLTNTMLNGAGPISIGFYHSYSLLGLLDDVKIYNYARTQEQILEDMYAGHPINTVESPQPNTQVTLGGSTEADDLSDGAGDPPIAEWKFDEKQGDTASDDSGNGNTGAITGATWASAGQCKQGACLIFNGSNNYFTVTDPVDGDLDFDTGDFTLESWFKAPDLSSDGTIITKGGTNASSAGYRLRLEAEGTFWVAASGGDGINRPSCNISSSSTFDDEAWHHVAAVFDRSSNLIKVYADGVYLDNCNISSITGQSVSSTSNFTIGYVPNTQYFQGLIDHVKIYDYARTPAQIAYDYNRGAPIAHYKMDECQGVTIRNAADPEPVEGTRTTDGTLNLGASGVTSAGTCQTSSTAWGNGSSGKYSSAMSFDGSDDYININNDTIHQPKHITISAWVNWNSISDDWIIAKQTTDPTNYNYGYLLRSDTPNNNLLCRIGLGTSFTGASSQTNTISAGAWNHLVCTYDGSNTYLYLNGNLIGSSALSGDIDYTNVGDLTIGGTTSRYIDGLIDDVKIFNYALSPNQIKKEFNAGSAIRFGP